METPPSTQRSRDFGQQTTGEMNSQASQETEPAIEMDAKSFAEKIVLYTSLQLITHLTEKVNENETLTDREKITIMNQILSLLNDTVDAINNAMEK